MKTISNFTLVAILACTVFTVISCTVEDDTMPTAKFTFTSTKSLPATVTFTNTTTNSGPGSTYLWEFGDGATSTAINPVHAYAAMGTYQVKLTHTPATGPAETVVKQFMVNTTGPSGTSSRPGQTTAADFSFTVSYGVPYIVTFINTSQEADLYHWNFGDNTTSTSGATTVTHTYNSPGPFYVVLTATNINGPDTSGALIQF